MLSKSRYLYCMTVSRFYIIMSWYEDIEPLIVSGWYSIQRSVMWVWLYRDLTCRALVPESFIQSIETDRKRLYQRKVNASLVKSLEELDLHLKMIEEGASIQMDMEASQIFVCICMLLHRARSFDSLVHYDHHWSVLEFSWKRGPVTFVEWSCICTCVCVCVVCVNLFRSDR